MTAGGAPGGPGSGVGSDEAAGSGRERETVTKNILLLDVDGVINAFGARPGRPRFIDLRSFVADNGFQIQYHQDIVDRIRGFHESGLAEVRWLTTWTHEANADLAPKIGMPDDLFVYERPRDDTRWAGSGLNMVRVEDYWWKARAAEAARAAGYRVAWLDDELAWRVDRPSPEMRWAVTAKEAGDPDLLMVSPEPSLTHGDLDMVQEFLS